MLNHLRNQSLVESQGPVTVIAKQFSAIQVHKRIIKQCVFTKEWLSFQSLFDLNY